MHMVHTNTKYNGTDYMNEKDGIAVVAFFGTVVDDMPNVFQVRYHLEDLVLVDLKLYF